MTYKMTTRRKLAIATWAAPREGNIYGKLTVNVTNALRYIEHLRVTTGEKITITHFVGKVAGMALKHAPDLNGRIAFGCYVPHQTVDVAFLIAVEEGADLAKFKVAHIDKKSVTQIAEEIRNAAKRLRGGKDEGFERSKPMLRKLPTWLIRPLVWVTGFVTGVLGMSVPALGLEAFPFGACIITSVGMLGMDEAYAPPTPFARVPVYLVLPSVKRRAVVVDDDRIEIQPQLDIMATIDHRFMDGYRAAVLAKIMRAAFENPWSVDGLEKAPWN